MTPRPIGQETEFAIRFTPDAGVTHPGSTRIFQALSNSVASIVATREGLRNDYNGHFFVENGGSFYHEFLPYAPEGGLIEGATPECFGPGELLLYQRAQESLLIRAVPLAEDELAEDGIPGKIGFIKNCRDAEGHIYGAQENYTADIGNWFDWSCVQTGATISVIATAAVVPFLFALTLALLLSLVLLRGSVLAWLHWRAGRTGRQSVWLTKLEEHLSRMMSDDFRATSLWIDYRLLYPLTFLLMVPHSIALRLFGFRKLRRRIDGFIVSRSIISGAGTLLEDDQFALSEKGVAVKQIARWFATPAARAIYDTSNLLKNTGFAATDLWLFRGRQFQALLEKRQRFQLGMSDSNRCQVAELLKIGATLLVIDMAEAGFLEQSPRPRNPVRAVHDIVRDPALKVGVATNQGRLSALDLQRWYLERAREFVAGRDDVPEEYAGIVRIWAEVLDALADDPGKLVGRLDWVSKRYLLETSGADVGPDARKKIDLAYHELGSGYYELLEREGIAPTLVGFDEIEEAITKPPSPASARRRSELIRDLSYDGKRVRVTWSSAQIGSFMDRERISFDSDEEE